MTTFRSRSAAFVFALVACASLVTITTGKALASQALPPQLLSAVMVVLGGAVDSDGDGVDDLEDRFPEDPMESSDTDGDGVGDNADAFPSDANESLDSDGDAIGNNADTDDDNDGIEDTYDPQPLVVTDMEPLLATFSEAFGGAVIDADSVFSFPSGAESWAGFANMNTAIYPFVFEHGGRIQFTALVPSGGSANVRFRFERLPYPDVDPAYNTEAVTVVGDAPQTYTIDIPSQGSNTFRSLILYLDNRDVGVSITDILVRPARAPETADADGDGVADSEDAFPNNPNESLDTDGDGVGNNADTDDDGDGVLDDDDYAPLDPDVTEQPADEVLAVYVNATVGSEWDRGINAFDQALDFSDCSVSADCPSISWETVTDTERGDVLQITHANNGNLAGVFFASTTGVDVSGYVNGAIEFDIKVVSGDANITMKLDCTYPCSSGDQLLGERGVDGWESVSVSMSQLRSSGLDLSKVNTGLVVWATKFQDTVFQIDNVRFTGFDADAGTSTPVVTVPYDLTKMGLGSYSDTINPASYRCAEDYGFWLYNAGVIGPTDLGTCANVEDAQPLKKMPQVAGAAANKHTMTHRWWGSIPFAAEAYITPDPIMARLSGNGVRITGIPSGLRVFTSMPGCGADDPPCVDIVDNNFGYVIPAPADEVMEAIAIGNTNHGGMTTKLLDYSEGSVTAGWFDGASLIMEATFVQGSPYVYFEVYSGKPLLKTLRPTGGERGVWYEGSDSLGVWTNVAGMRNHFMVVGDAGTSFDNVDSEAVTVNSPSNAFTLAWMPTTGESVADGLRDSVKRQSRNVVDKVQIDYSVDRGTNTVSVTHRYLDNSDQTVDTLAGLMPMAWKRAESLTAVASVRSARGVIKYAEQSSFTYDLPSVGVLPSLPVVPGSLDENQLRTLVDDFVALGPSSWNTADDTYWNGKAVGRLAEVLALANQLGMTEATSTLLDWLKGELADWMSAERDGTLDHINYFVYDDDWNTLLGMDEAFYSHALLQDHHFHYGYFVRAAAEVCRIEPDFCGPDQYGPMFELLIRDYAAGRDDPLFPYLRNFDPAFGFSWASGAAGFNRGNNNESTSEAANAYGAMVLYGLVTGNDEIAERGMYLHASTSASFWEYWNDIDGYRGVDAEKRNFPPGYSKITTSIIWGDGADFATWFSRRYAHILGIQGLPSNPLIMHVGLYADYLDDYVYLGMAESRKVGNGKPSGLPPGLWTDLWWNLWAMTDADSAIADYEATATYEPEAGEAPAHTYHWLYTMKALGELQTGTGELTADYPAAMAFKTGSTTNYVVYNYDDVARSVTFSDGTVVEAAPAAFTIE